MFDYWKVRWFLMFPPNFTEETLANAGCFLIWSLFLCCSARWESLRVSQQQKQVQNNSFRSWYRNSTIAVPRSANVRQFPSSQTPWRHVTMHHWIWLEWPLIEIIPLKSQGSHVIPCYPMLSMFHCELPLNMENVPIFMLFRHLAGWLTCSPFPSAASWVSPQTTSGSCCGTNFVPAAEPSWRRDGRPNHRCSSTDCWLTFPHSSELALS